MATPASQGRPPLPGGGSRSTGMAADAPDGDNTMVPVGSRNVAWSAALGDKVVSPSDGDVEKAMDEQQRQSTHGQPQEATLVAEEDSAGRTPSGGGLVRRKKDRKPSKVDFWTPLEEGASPEGSLSPESPMDLAATMCKSATDPQRRFSDPTMNARDSRCFASNDSALTQRSERPYRKKADSLRKRGPCGTLPSLFGRRGHRLRSYARGNFPSPLFIRNQMEVPRGRWAKSEGTPSSLGNSSVPRHTSPERKGNRRSGSGSPGSAGSLMEARCSDRSVASSGGGGSRARSTIGSTGGHRHSLTTASWGFDPATGEHLRAVDLLRQRRVQAPKIDVNGQEFQNFKAAVLANCLCAGLGEREVLQLAHRADLFVFEGGDKIIENGETGTHFFVVVGGRFSMQFPGTAALEVGAGTTFGELAVVHDCPQRVSVTAVGAQGSDKDDRPTCWGVDRDSFRQTMVGLAERTHQENLLLLDNVRLFQYLDPGQKRAICATLVVHLYIRGQHITHEGTTQTDCMFIVKSGMLEVTVRGQRVATLGAGDCFGERAWLYKEPRSATVTAAESSVVVAVRRKLLEQVLGIAFKDMMWRNVIFVALRDYNLEQRLPSRRCDLQALTEAFIIQAFPPRSDVITEEREARGLRFVVVLSGEVVVKGPGHPVGQRLRRGQCFGEEYLADITKPFQHSIENPSEEPCELALISADAAAALVDASGVQTMLTQKQKMALVRKVYVFRHLSNHHCRLIANSFRTISRKKGECAVKEGDIGSQFFVINSGELVVTIKGQTIRTLGKSDYFGERGLLYDEPRTATVTCLSKEAELMVIDKAVFIHIVEGKMLGHLEERIRLQQTDLTLDDLRFTRIVGRGTFGVVRLVEHRSRGTQYALKCISRAEAVKNDQQVNLRLEREILLENDHPFIVKVVRTFKDKRYLYFLTELVTGGELYSTIRVIGLLSKPQAQFYTGSMILALESLHERNIAYRDLKPENVLLDSQGFIKLIDFGCAAKLRGYSYTICGTPHYMAPEVIYGNGYALSCDVWSLGVCLYEFMCGPLPFAVDVEDPMDVFREVLVAKLRFPMYVRDPSSLQLMRSLLRRPIEKRIGCSRSGWREIRRHAYFRDFSFDRLLSRQLDPPLVPRQPSFAEDVASAEDAVDLPQVGNDSGSESGLSGAASDQEEINRTVPLAEPNWDADF